MQILENYSLKNLNTFGIDCIAKQFAVVSSLEDLKSIYENPLLQQTKKLCMGGGSNILFTQNFEGLVFLNRIPGRSIKHINDNEILVSVGAGEVWQDFVAWTVHQGWWGLENLSLIPGRVGAAPIQNIGAYGVEVQSVIVEVEIFDTETLTTRALNAEDCEFSYRHSIFKTDRGQNWIVTRVTFKLSSQPKPQLNYKGLSDALLKRGVKKPTLQDLAWEVIQIRRSKLPDPNELGNAGSFFKNPIITEEQYQDLFTLYPHLVSFRERQGFRKIAAGWLIDIAGFKGIVNGNCGVHDQQALVLVNHGGATGCEILSLAHRIQGAIQSQFGIKLEFEVNIL